MSDVNMQPWGQFTQHGHIVQELRNEDHTQHQFVLFDLSGEKVAGPFSHASLAVKTAKFLLNIKEVGKDQKLREGLPEVLSAIQRAIERCSNTEEAPEQSEETESDTDQGETVHPDPIAT